MLIKIKESSIYQVSLEALGYFSSDDGWAYASHIALSALMALFPFLIFATTLASFLGADAFASTAIYVIFEMWPPAVAGPIANEVKNVLTVQRSGVLTISVITAAYFASNGVEALRIALNRAYRVTDTRSIIFCRLQSLGFVLIGTISIMAISFLLVLAPLAVKIGEHIFPEITLFSGTIAFWRYFIAISVLFFALFVMHLWLPAGHRTIGDILPGIILTLLAWLTASVAFAKYLATFANYVSIYAGLASIMIAIVFLYMLSAIFIIGAGFNAAIMNYRNREQQPELMEQ